MDAANGITLDFLGGADEIGASSALVSAGGTNVLVDCGVRFRAGRALPDLAALTGRRLDAILVTHAHSDHTGGLPVAHEAFPATPIFLSPPTLDLVRILQRDALKLMADGWEREGEIPLYTPEAVESMLHVVRAVKFGESFAVGAIEVTLFPASHILGAAMIHLSTPAGSVLFTGDYSVEAQRTVPALDPPPLPADVVVTESTYGNRLHADRKAAERRLVSRVREVLDGGGRVLIPAFAIGRAQEVLLILRAAFERGELPDVPVFVDGMVRAVCEVYARHPRYVTNSLAKRMRRGHPFYSDRIRAVKHPDDRRDALAAGPAVIVASSGMLSGGPSAFYAAELAPNERDAILVTGYQDEESPGRALLRLAEAEGPRTLRLGEREVPVRCSFDTYGLSAHADRMQMVGLLGRMRPRCVVLVHGDEAAKKHLAGTLECPDVVLAANGDRVERAYGARRRPPPPSRPEIDVDPERARRLVADAPGDRISVARLGEAFFGRKAPAVLVDRLVRRLEELGVVARDDHRRGLLHVLVADAQEEGLAEELKAENPKGRLLEYCMRRGVEPPEFAATPVAGGRHRVSLRFETEGEVVESGAFEAGTPLVAEQLAARALLGKLAAAAEPDGAERVDAAEAERLRAENPKGRLLERCTRARRCPPEFTVEPLPGGGFAGYAALDAWEEGPLESVRFRGESAKVVEQAAAADLLARLPEDRPAAGADAPAGPDPRLALNRWRQTEQILDFGYEAVDVRGPSHRPEFSVRAWAERRDGPRVETDPVAAGSKKEAQRLAAAALVDLLRSTSPSP